MTVPSIAIVGAGPYGLALAAELTRLGVEHAIFGARPMGSWQDHMPAGMMLKSLPPFSSIYAATPGHSMTDFCQATGRPAPSRIDDVVPADLFVAYGRWYQQQLVPHLRAEDVAEVRAAGGGFEVALRSGERLPFARVVAATGTPQFHRLPPILERFRKPHGGARVSHTCDHRDLSGFAGQTVVVIGAGQSALENAVIMAEQGATVHLIVRSARPIPWGARPYEKGLVSRLCKPETPLGPGWSFVAFTGLPDWVSLLPLKTRLHLMRTVLGPGGGWWLHERFRRSGVRAHPGAEIDAIEPHGDRLAVRVSNGSGKRLQIDADHVMAGTGYQIDVDRITILDPALRHRTARLPGTRAPRLSRAFASSVAGLYFAGLAAAPTFGPLLRFVAGAGFTARAIAADICAAR